MDEPLVRVERAVAAAVRRYGLWKPGARVVVAVSGGADSLCLVGALLALRAQGATYAPDEIIVAHLDHGLRGAEGREDAAWVEEFAREQELRFVGAAVDVAAIAKQERRSLEDAARNARYAFLRRSPSRSARTASAWDTLATIRPRPFCCICCVAPDSQGWRAWRC